MKVEADPSRNAAAAAISSGVPSRPVPDASIMVRMSAPFAEASSCWPIGVEMIPGLIELIRAPRRPHRTLAVATRIWLARLAIPYAIPGSVI